MFLHRLLCMLHSIIMLARTGSQNMSCYTSGVWGSCTRVQQNSQNLWAHYRADLTDMQYVPPGGKFSDSWDNCRTIQGYAQFLGGTCTSWFLRIPVKRRIFYMTDVIRKWARVAKADLITRNQHDMPLVLTRPQLLLAYILPTLLRWKARSHDADLVIRIAYILAMRTRRSLFTAVEAPVDEVRNGRRCNLQGPTALVTKRSHGTKFILCTSMIGQTRHHFSLDCGPLRMTYRPFVIAGDTNDIHVEDHPAKLVHSGLLSSMYFVLFLIW